MQNTNNSSFERISTDSSSNIVEGSQHTLMRVASGLLRCEVDEQKETNTCLACVYVMCFLRSAVAFHHLGGHANIRPCIRQLTTAYDSSRQLTTAYDSLRQLTTAYDSLRWLSTTHDCFRRLTTVYDNLRQLTTAYNGSRQLTTAQWR